MHRTSNYQFTGSSGARNGQNCGSGVDLLARGGTIRLPAGERSVSIAVPLCPDNEHETEAQRFMLTITGENFRRLRGRFEIEDDDAPRNPKLDSSRLKDRLFPRRN